MENDRIQELLEALSDPVVLVNARRHVVAANRSAHDMLETVTLGRDLALSIRHPDALDAVSRVLAGQTRCMVTLTETVPVARVLEMNIAGLPETVADTGLASARAVCHLSDVTASRESERMRADFVANVSHELRSPLSVLIGFIETLKASVYDDLQATARFLDIMDIESQRMARLVDDLLSLSRVEACEHILPTTVIDLREVIDEVVYSVSARAREKNVNIDCLFDTNIRSITGDRDEMVEVFHNLVDNALKYGRKKLPIRIRVQDEPRIPDIGSPGIAITVRNFGLVIAAEHIPRLTERFYRIDRGRSRSEGGTGLGLAIVKHIVNHHRGRLLIESSAETGNEFTVFLPLTNNSQ